MFLCRQVCRTENMTIGMSTCTDPKLAKAMDLGPYGYAMVADADPKLGSGRPLDPSVAFLLEGSVLGRGPKIKKILVPVI